MLEFHAMKKARRILFGYRDDLDLSSKWWHRLIKVLFVVISVMVAVTLLSLLYVDPAINRRNVVIVETLDSFNKKHPELASTIPAFERTGHLVKVAADGELTPYYMFSSDFFCSGNMAANVNRSKRLSQVCGA